MQLLGLCIVLSFLEISQTLRNLPEQGNSNQHDVIGNGLASWALILMTSHGKIIRFLAKTNLILYPSHENMTTQITIGPSNQHDVVGNGLASWALILRTSHLSNEKEEKTRRHQRLHHRSVHRCTL